MGASTVLETIGTGKGELSIVSEHITADEYIRFLATTDLGQQYPKERFRRRIERLVANTQISLVVRDGAGAMVGMCFGLTDFAYWLLVTDLGIARDYTKLGLGTRLVRLARELAGGTDDIIQFIYANDDAVGFYEKLGMRKATSMMELTDVEWTDFEVGKDEYGS